MNKPRTINLDFETLAWGTLILWWGIRWLFAFLPNGTGLIGTGLILLGLNAARSLSGIPIKASTTAVGILALVLGAGLVLTTSVLHLSVELPVFETLLMGLGVIVLARAFKKPETTTGAVRKTGFGDLR
ncbi:MAG: hypothetical protein HZB53_14860 [Chloroflexi bacterium]|nr:hypothetical protein [Chloroflexota bacterium]